MICYYIAGTGTDSNCFYNVPITFATDLDNTTQYTFEILQGSAGVINQVQIEEFFKVPEVFVDYASMMASTKIDMRRTISNTANIAVNRICIKCGNKLLESGE